MKKYGHVFGHNTPWPSSVMWSFQENGRTNVSRLMLTTAMQCSAIMTTPCCWLRAALFVLCLVDQCYSNLNLYLSQSEVRRLLGKSFWTRKLLKLSFTVSSSGYTPEKGMQDAGKFVSRIVEIPQLDFFRHGLGEFRSDDFSVER